MTRSRTGSPLLFLVLCLGGWVLTRGYAYHAFSYQPPDLTHSKSIQHRKRTLRLPIDAMQLDSVSKAAIWRNEKYSWVSQAVANSRSQGTTARMRRYKAGQFYSIYLYSIPSPAVHLSSTILRPTYAPHTADQGYGATTNPLLANRLTEPVPKLAASTNANTHPVPDTAAYAPKTREALKQRDDRKRATLYAYGFWRKGDLDYASGSYNAVGPASYGASQYGMIATIPLSQDGLDINLRTSGSPQSKNDVELAAGIRWQPVKKVPLQLIAERRFRPYSYDHFAAIAVLAPKAFKLGRNVEVTIYGQAGSIFDKDVTKFFDASTNISKHWNAGTKARLGLGAGGWTGGQKNGYRVDTGPLLWAEASVGKVPIRLQADWRFRIAGNARPDDGPSVTISTGF